MKHSVILGIDPGSQVTGFCVLKSGSSLNLKNNRIMDAGVIKPKRSMSHGERLGQIHDAVFEIIAENTPAVCVIEKGFTGINNHSALRLGETRGAIIAAARRLSVTVEETTPTEVKKNVAGNGHATKEAISQALKALIGFDRGNLPFDVSDAVAIALSFSMSWGLQSHLQTHNLNGLPNSK